MSDPVTPLNAARYAGFCTVQEIGPMGMITLRGALSELGDAVRATVGVDVPALRRVAGAGDRWCAWMSPDELLMMLPRADVAAALVRLGDELAGVHHLSADVSDARALFRVTGPLSREVLAKLTPADMAPLALAPGEMRRTRLAQVAAAVRVVKEGEIEVICLRSVAQYVFDLLSMSARPGGEVSLFSA